MEMVAGADEELGDETFDEQVLVRGDEVAVTATLTEATRAVILEMITKRSNLKKVSFILSDVAILTPSPRFKTSFD